MLFDSSSSALYAERLATSAGLSVRLVLTPREFDSSCAICLRFDAGSSAFLLAAVEGKVVHLGVHALSAD